jgi:hypothetical protein
VIRRDHARIHSRFLDTLYEIEWHETPVIAKGISNRSFLPNKEDLSFRKNERYVLIDAIDA